MKNCAPLTSSKNHNRKIKWACSLLLGVSLLAAPLKAAFTDPNFITETIYEGNGMISMDFDAKGRLYVSEKQGRILVLEPNDQPGFDITYEYYEGTWTELPDFDSLTAVATGTVGGFDLDPRLQDDNFGFRYTATLTINTSDDYTFYTTSDDGSRLLIDGNVVVDNDGLHGNVTESGTLTLEPGDYTIVVEFFENGGGESLTVEWESATLPRQLLGGAGGDFLPPVVVADVSSAVNTDGERGFSGMVLDPDFLNNRYIYLFYSTSTDQRLTRITVDGSYTAMVPGSETVLLDGLPNTTNVHNAGDIHFHPEDPYNLYVVLGDDGNRYIVDDLSKYNGKLLRVDAATGLGLPGNPYWNGDADSVTSRIWAHSFRNPFRFTFDPATPDPDALYVSENGDGTDRLARIEKGADGGWPSDDFLQSAVDGSRTILRTHNPSATAVIILRGGPFAPDGPVIYQARYGTEINRWNLVGSNFDQLEAIPADGGQPFLTNPPASMVSFELGPDGALYYTDSNQGASLGSGYKLGRIRYQGGQAPVAAFTTDGDDFGEAPFTIDFIDQSTAPDSTLATWSWDFGDGNSSTQASPQHSYSQPGVYSVSLTVTNAAGLLDTAEASIRVYQTVALSLDGTVYDARTGGSLPIGEALQISLFQSDGSTPALTSGGSGTDGNEFTIPLNGIIDLDTNVQLTHPSLVILIGAGNTSGFIPQRSGFDIDLDSSAALDRDFYFSDTAITGRALDTRGNPAQVDIGIFRDSTTHAYALANGRDLSTDSPIPPTGVSNRLDSDPLGYYYFPIATTDGTANFHLSTPGDTGGQTYGHVSIDIDLVAGAAVYADLILGLYDGGTNENDLSSIAETPDVDFASQIQPIFTANCIGCHTDIATNSGGLDLQAGASWNELVDRFSIEAPGIRLVAPGSPERSYLMEKITSEIPQVGTRMRPNDPMPLAEQALIRDWISQLTPYKVWSEQYFTGSENTAPEEDYDEDTVANIVEFALLTNPTINDHSAAQAIIRQGLDGALNIELPQPNTNVSLEWQSSFDLSPESWMNIATRAVNGNWILEGDYAVATDPNSGHFLLKIPAPSESEEDILFFRLVIEEN